jgi:transcriptional regulator with GAF, ATPase, and Fis domain
MSIRALKFTSSLDGGGPFQSKLEAESNQAFAKAKAQALPVAYVVRNTDLALLRRLRDVIIDRKEQTRGKELAPLLLRQEKAPLLSSRYTASGRLRQGIHSLLARALKLGDCNLYLIGVDERLFNELWEQAALEEAQEPPDRSQAGEKPTDNLRPASLLAERLRRNLPREMLEKYGDEVAKRYIGHSEEIEIVRLLILLAATVEDAVLILGENGTGKEIVARSIHDYSERRSKPFLSVNCAAISPMLLEMELFGVRHTGGGLKFKKGLFELGDKGTLFLDEIGDMQSDHQAKVLRAIELGVIRPVGAEQEMKVDTRIIAATNRELASMVEAKQFRMDLYQRLNQFPIRTPSLDSHPEDIPDLAARLWRDATGDQSSSLPQAIITRLQACRWPGNVRQLKAVLRRLKNWFGKDGVSLEDLESLLQYAGQSTSFQPGSGEVQQKSLHQIECLLHLRRVEAVARTCEIDLQPLVNRGEIEQQRIEIALALTNQHVVELERLCRQSNLFGDEETYMSVHHLAGNLRFFLGLLQQRDRDLPQRWRSRFAQEFKQAHLDIAQRIEQLRKEI